MVKLRWPINSRFTHRKREFRIKGPGVHDVPEEHVERYRKRGWVKPEQDPAPVESESGSESGSETEAEPEAEPDQTFTSEAEAEPVSEPEAEATPETEPEPEPEGGDKNKNKSKSKKQKQDEGEDPAEDTEAFAEDVEEEQRSAGESWSPTREDLESMTHSRLRQLAAESESDEINGNSSSEEIIRVLSRDDETAPEIGGDSNSDESESESESESGE